jgi:predicted metal-dependent hydrolase
VPHPIRDPKGHSHNRKPRSPQPLVPESWADNRTYLIAVDFFNMGYYWEAHEEWERLWRVSGPDSTVGRFLKGLVKLSAAGVKVREKSIHGVRRHAASAGEVFADVAAEVGSERYCGLEFTMLQFAADRAAQLSYKQEIAPGKPFRVFPFLLQPEPMPFS